MTTKDKLNQAFELLASRGYFVKQNFWCCQTCGWAAVPEDKAGSAIFYHEQDNDAWDETGEELGSPLHLAWSGNCDEIVRFLEYVGLKVEHDGSENTRIKILPE